MGLTDSDVIEMITWEIGPPYLSDGLIIKCAREENEEFYSFKYRQGELARYMGTVKLNESFTIEICDEQYGLVGRGSYNLKVKPRYVHPNEEHMRFAGQFGEFDFYIYDTPKVHGLVTLIFRWSDEPQDYTGGTFEEEQLLGISEKVGGVDREDRLLLGAISMMPSLALVVFEKAGEPK